MFRSSRTSARIARPLAAALAVALAAPAAFAQTATPQPVVDSVRSPVWLGKPSIVRGRLENGAPGDEVTIEKRRRSGGWKALQTKPVDEENRVAFRIRNRRTTAGYRLTWTDDVTETIAASDAFRVRVRPRVTIRTSPRHPFSGNKIVVRGAVRPARPGRTVRVQQRAGGEWKNIARVRVRDGRYRTAFNAGRSRRTRVRAIFAGDEYNTRRVRTTRVKIFDPDQATWYGPGLYGNSTACGKRLTPDTLGVAHRSLPCGTMVDIVYRGRKVRVPVIDRGPYTSARWDLTKKTADRLNFSGRNTVGTLH